MEKIFDNYKGVVLFYVIITILSLLWISRTSNNSVIGNNVETETNYYAMNK